MRLNCISIQCLSVLLMPHFPEHKPPTIYEMRSLWVRYRGNGVVQRLILEIQHLRGFVHKVESLRTVPANSIP